MPLVAPVQVARAGAAPKEPPPRYAPPPGRAASAARGRSARGGAGRGGAGRAFLRRTRNGLVFENSTPGLPSRSAGMTADPYAGARPLGDSVAPNGRASPPALCGGCPPPLCARAAREPRRAVAAQLCAGLSPGRTCSAPPRGETRLAETSGPRGPGRSRAGDVAKKRASIPCGDSPARGGGCQLKARPRKSTRRRPAAAQRQRRRRARGVCGGRGAGSDRRCVRHLCAQRPPNRGPQPPPSRRHRAAPRCRRARRARRSARSVCASAAGSA